MNMMKRNISYFMAASLLLATPSYSFGDGSERSTNATRIVEYARGYLNTEYNFGGRLTKNNPGLDCLGLLFLAYSKATKTSWLGLSVNPSQLVKSKKLGEPVKGLEGILCKEVDVSRLEEGDVIYLLSRIALNDRSLVKINGVDYWPWHVILYSNKKRNLSLEANPVLGVVELDFDEILKSNEAIFVTRI